MAAVWRSAADPALDGFSIDSDRVRCRLDAESAGEDRGSKAFIRHWAPRHLACRTSWDDWILAKTSAVVQQRSYAVLRTSRIVLPLSGALSRSAHDRAVLGKAMLGERLGLVGQVVVVARAGSGGIGTAVCRLVAKAGAWGPSVSGKSDTPSHLSTAGLQFRRSVDVSGGKPCTRGTLSAGPWPWSQWR